MRSLIVYGNADGIQHRSHRREMFAAGLVEILADLGQLLDDRLVLRNFAVEHAQRIGLRPALAVGVHQVHHRLQGLAQRLVVARAIFGTAHRIQLQLPIAQADFVEQRGQHLQHFGIAQRRLAARTWRPDDLCANLVELAIASFLRTLAAKLRSNVVQLLQRAFLVKTVLDVGAHHAGCVLRTQGKRLRPFALRTGLVLPGEHLLGDDVGLFAHAAREELGVLEDWGANLVEVVAREDVAHLRVHPVPQVSVGREKVASSTDGFDHENQLSGARG